MQLAILDIEMQAMCAQYVHRHIVLIWRCFSDEKHVRKVSEKFKIVEMTQNNHEEQVTK